LRLNTLAILEKWSRIVIGKMNSSLVGIVPMALAMVLLVVLTFVSGSEQSLAQGEGAYGPFRCTLTLVFEMPI